MRVTHPNNKPALRKWLGFLVVPGFLLLFLLTACGTNTSSGGTGSSGPSNTPTTVSGYGTAYGCPSNAVVTNEPSANVMVQLSQINTTIAAHTGDVIEIRLPFGHKWGGPTASQGQLELQTPSGYASKANNVCVWLFTAKGTGTTQLNFSSQALCKPGEMCPQYIMEVPFTISVK